MSVKCGSHKQTSARLFDHLVRSRQQRRRHGEAEGAGGAEVDRKLEFGRLLDRQEVCAVDGRRMRAPLPSGLFFAGRVGARVDNRTVQKDSLRFTICWGVSLKPDQSAGRPRKFSPVLHRG